MRVVTLLPAATEIVAAVGGAGLLVGISHECDHPPELGGLPRVTTTPVQAAASSAAIDAEVRRLGAEGRPVIPLDAGELGRLAPDLVITQGLCEVCAVADGEVHRLAGVLQPVPRVLSLAATTLEGILADIQAVGRALGREGEAHQVVGDLAERVRRLRAGRPERAPRVLCVEWLDPLYLAGHWVPDLVEAAGGRDVGASAGSHSARREWHELAALEPDVLVVMLCGFDTVRATRELARVSEPAARRLLAGCPVWVLDGNAYTSRPGPRVVDGAERLRAVLEDREVPGLVRWRCPWPGQ